jgi:hypothetical protein
VFLAVFRFATINHIRGCVVDLVAAAASAAPPAALQLMPREDRRTCHTIHCRGSWQWRQCSSRACWVHLRSPWDGDGHVR